MEAQKSSGRRGRGGGGRQPRSQPRRQPRGGASQQENQQPEMPTNPPHSDADPNGRGKRRRGGRGRGDLSSSRPHIDATRQQADEVADVLRHKKTASGSGDPSLQDDDDFGQAPLTEPVPDDTPRFAELLGSTLVNPVLIETITNDLKFDHMMPVQAATLHELLPPNRSDCLVQAKTGTGKTVAFLLPALQTLIQRSQGSATQGRNGISLLVISPTRELAMQIAKEATNLLQRLRKYRVTIAIGGTNKNEEEKKILAGCDVLIATPGRLLDHLSNEEVQYTLRSLDTLVLDEADRLLDMGFKRDLTDIVRRLPDKEKTGRQGMLFSATIAPHVTQVANLVLSPGYKFISTIPEGEANTHQRVPQILIKVDRFSSVMSAMVSAIRGEMERHPGSFKAIIFAPTAALAGLYGHVLSQVSGGLPSVMTLHSRMSQSKRTKITNDYRNATSAILAATDVIARGMDFPGVTTVFQVGIPADKESYIHRLGRTARAGAEGRGIFIVSEAEAWFPRWTLKDISFLDYEPSAATTASTSATASEVQRIVVGMEDEEKGRVYQAWLGYYKNHMKLMKWDREQLVEQGNIYATDGLGAPETPSIAKSTVSKMGLKGTKGLVVVPDPQRHPGQRRGGGGGRPPRGRSG